MPVIANEPKRLTDLLKVTENQLWDAGYMTAYVSAQEAAATDYEIGMLLGTDGTSYKISDPAAVDGSQTIAAVVIENKSLEAATATPVKVLVRGAAIVADQALVLGTHTLANAKAALEAFNPPVLVGNQL